jgi:hypothetical protein
MFADTTFNPSKAQLIDCMHMEWYTIFYENGILRADAGCGIVKGIVTYFFMHRASWLFLFPLPFEKNEHGLLA